MKQLIRPPQDDLSPRPTDSTSLSEARQWLRERINEGEHCPCCSQFAKVYRRKVTSGAARSLCVLARRRGFVHVPSVGQLARQGGEIARMSYWGLVEEENAVRPDGGRAGWWRVTDLGRRFVGGEATIQKYALVYDGRCLGFRGSEVDIRSCLGDKFDLRELLEEAS